jgi:hypothetical protein
MSADLMPQARDLARRLLPEHPDRVPTDPVQQEEAIERAAEMLMSWLAPHQCPHCIAIVEMAEVGR